MEMKNEMLIKLRNIKELTQEQAAQDIGISRSMLAMMESGDRVGSYHTLKKVADYYGKSVEELFEQNFFNQDAHEVRQKIQPA
jgi:putative transcriptional regulator